MTVFVKIKATAGGMAVSLNALLGVALMASPALAAPAAAETEEAPAEATEAPAEAAAEEPAPAPEEKVVLEETPAPEAKPEPPKPPLIAVYGIIKPEIIVAKGAETFGRAILVAPTAASNPIADPNYEHAALSFQIQQTRFGIKIGEGGPLSGRLEIDFVDSTFSLSSPIQAARPRLRLAYATYKPGPQHTIMVGQNWDIFSPVNPLTMNMVGASFQAGNSAFLRPQVAYTYGTGQGIEIAGAIGLRAQNTGTTLANLEYGLVPSFAVQAGYRMGKTWFGISGIISAEQTQLEPNRVYASTFAGNLFANWVATDWLTLLGEMYIGKNTNALGLLTLGSGATVTDAGGHVSANIKFAQMHSLWVLAGVAGVLNPGALPIGYTPATTVDPITPAARLGIGGITSNVNLRATYVLTPMEGLQFYVEPFIFLTRHKLNAADDPTGELASRVAPGAQIGSKYTF